MPATDSGCLSRAPRTCHHAAVSPSGRAIFFYDPDGDVPADRRFPFATIVTNDYDGFDRLPA
ncbi:MAG: hypothetical protein H0V41_11195 [Pseudonocardiales bacterium]|nr:hypothetical protein [Pseudonocardiales bacterium]